MISKEELLTEFQEELDSLHCDLWFSTTFRSKALVMPAEKAFKYFFKSYLNQPDRIFFEKFILCWVLFDKRDSREGVHIHSLIKGIDPSLAPLLQKKSNAFFGQSDVRPYDHSISKNRSASHYLAEKYVREEFDHYGFYKINSRLRR